MMVMRIVLDTDVVVAGLRSRRGASRVWLRAVLRKEIDVVLSVPLVLQYEEVLLRPDILAAIDGTPKRVGQFSTFCAPSDGRSRSPFSGGRPCAIRMMRWCSRRRYTVGLTGSDVQPSGFRCRQEAGVFPSSGQGLPGACGKR